MLATLGAAYLLKLSGFCFSAPGWHSDRSLIEAAFQYELEGGWSNTPAVADVDAFIDAHPRCCSVSNSRMLPDGLEAHLLNALFGRRFYAVTINYPVTDPNESDGRRFYESILIMDCCGKYVPDSYGMAFDTPIPEGPAPKVVRQRRT